MTEEIKEMLNDLKNKDSYVNDETILTFNEGNILYNYITNLQQENEKLKLDVRYWENKWQNTRFANNQVKVLQDTIIKSANNTNKAMEQTEIYKSRCEKAMELLKLPIVYETHQENGERDELLKRIRQAENILNGSDENE